MIPFFRPIPYSLVDFVGHEFLFLSEPEVTK